MSVPARKPASKGNPLPVNYLSAKQALATCSRVDECKAWATPRFYRGGKMDASGMVFFPRDEFFVFHQGPACDLPLFKDLPVPPTRPFRDVEEM